MQLLHRHEIDHYRFQRLRILDAFEHLVTGIGGMAFDVALSNQFLFVLHFDAAAEVPGADDRPRGHVLQDRAGVRL